MRGYCITLDKTNLLRAVPAMREIQRLGLECEFVDGVNLKGRPLAEFKDVLSTRAYRELSEGRQVDEALSGLGSVGCYMAHHALWKRCAEGNEPIAIFEDDAQFARDAPQRLPILLRDAEQRNYDVLRLSYAAWRSGPPVSAFLRRTSWGMSAAAYVITPKAARLAVEHAFPMEMHCDLYLDALCLKHGLNQYYPIVPLFVSRGLPSTLEHSALQQCHPTACWTYILGLVLIGALCLFAFAMYRIVSPTVNVTLVSQTPQ